VTDNVSCSLIAKDDNNIAAVQFEIKHFDFSTSLNSSVIIYIYGHNTVNYLNALDRLHVHMNIILFRQFSTKKCHLACNILLTRSAGHGAEAEAEYYEAKTETRPKNIFKAKAEATIGQTRWTTTV